MPLFHRESAEERRQKEEARAAADLEAQIQSRSLQALASGGIPVRAQERVAQLGGTAGHAPPFSSDLSVDELLLVRKSGYEPMGLVSGSSVYHIGWNRWTYTGEMEAQTRALFDAANLAIQRLRLEAHGMGALGVVGVDIEIKQPAWSRDLIEVIVIGTAIKVPGSAPAPEPFVSGFSGQEYITLLQAGSRPAGLAFGNCTYYIYTDWRTARQDSSWRNQEVGKYSHSLRDAQRHAFGRMHAHARNHKADGIVGVHIEHTLRPIEYEDNDETRTDYIVQYISWGTAIVQAPAPVQIARPSLVLDLEDLARSRRVTSGSEGGAR